ncbi:MAG: NfeD family protein [Clostridia bacterium]|nr:NfeD family protein [Clostridia bacterium]
MELLPIWAIWLILCGIFFIIEIATISFLFLWPGIGAFIAFIICIFGFDLKVQISVFAFISVILIIFTKPLVKKIFKMKDVPMNNKSVIGKNGVVLKTIDNKSGKGQIKVSGEVWSARSINEDIIEEGTTVLIDSIDGVRLNVKKV